MNTMLVSSRHHRIVKATAFAMGVVLIAALSGCTTVHELPDSYDLTVSSTSGGSVVDPGKGTFRYDSGEVVGLLAEPDEGYGFVNWIGDVAGIDDVDAASTIITMNGDYSITANFEPVPIVACELSVSSTAGGSVTGPGEGVFKYDSDTVVELVAVADECFEFTSWSGDAVGDPYSATTTMSITIGAVPARSVTANFARPRYELTTNSTAFGSVSSPGEGTFTYDCGAVVELVAEAGIRSRFVGWSGDVDGIADVHVGQTTVTLNRSVSVTASFEVVPMVAAGVWHTLGLKSDGTLLATGYGGDGQCDIEPWSDIVEVAGGQRHTVGLKSDGTVVAVGSNEYGQCNVGNWTGIVQIDAGKHHTVGLRPDGAVIATGWNEYGQCDVDGWTGMIGVVAGFYHTLGLRSDGTVVAVGVESDGRLEVGAWTDIIQLAAGAHHTVGLRGDGTLVAVGRNQHGECDLDDWTGIVHIGAGCRVTVGVRSDGTVLAAGWNDYGQCHVTGWSDIVQVDGGIAHMVGLRGDGTVVAVGLCSFERCDVGDWMLG